MQIDLHLNHRKPEVTVIDALTLSSLDHGITRISGKMPGIGEVSFDSMSLNGSVIGDGSLHTTITRCTMLVELIHQRVRNLDPYWALSFLTHLYFVPKSWLCAANITCLHETTFAEAIDDVVREAFVQRSNVHLCDISWTQASLPLRFGD